MAPVKALLCQQQYQKVLTVVKDDLVSDLSNSVR